MTKNGKTRVIIFRTAGTNCDMETAFAFEQAGAVVDRVHINRVMESPKMLNEYQILSIAGGFSYGDDISAGRIFAVRLLHDLGHALSDFGGAGKLVLGICNGFQVLVKAGLLPVVQKAEDFVQTVTLSDNESGRYEDRWVHLESFSDRCVFMPKGRRIYLPVAHAEGKFIPKDDATLKQLVANDQIVFRYVDENGQRGGFPINPNGAIDDIAGICDTTGRVMGMMPHPERHIERTQHPQWTRLPEDAGGDGRVIFEQAVKYFA